MKPVVICACFDRRKIPFPPNHLRAEAQRGSSAFLLRAESAPKGAEGKKVLEARGSEGYPDLTPAANAKSLGQQPRVTFPLNQNTPSVTSK